MGKYTLDFTASEINERLSKLDDQPISMELVWQNASPDSDFISQEITLNLEAYAHVAVMYRFHKDSVVYKTGFIPVESAGRTLKLDAVHGSNGSIYGAYRDFYVWTTRVGCGGGWYATASQDTAANNYIIPYKIYGIKGVQ